MSSPSIDPRPPRPSGLPRSRLPWPCDPSRSRPPRPTGRRPARSTRAAALALLALTPALLVGCAEPESGEDSAAPVTEEEALDSAAYLRPADLSVETVLDSLPTDTVPGHPSWTELDWRIFREVTRWAWAAGLERTEVPQAMVRMGRRFLGTRYVPYTLEAEGEERIVVNLRALDCVTYIENMLALTWFVRSQDPSILEDRDRAMEVYEGFLEDIRYRDGELDGYASRLHYFTDWLHDNEESGLLRQRTRELGGVRVSEPIDFMTTHRESYRQLGEQANWERVRETERRLTAMERFYVPQDSVAGVADRIREGDIIAATSSVEGLDVAHTGIAVRVDGRLHLMHAPLVGEDVQISEVPLADRILRIDGQDGIKVATPLPHPGEAGAADADPSAGGER